MIKRFRTIIIIGLIALMSLSCIQVDNTSDTFNTSTAVIDKFETFVVVDSTTYNVNRGASSIEQQDYWNNNTSARLSTSFFERSQRVYRSYGKDRFIIAVLDAVSRMALFSIVMILLATGCAGLSMPFRCLLFYIHNKDGKKIA